MRTNLRPAILLACAILVPTPACSVKTLEGGSNQPDAGPSSPAQDGSTANAPFPTTPLSGTIQGKAFGIQSALVRSRQDATLGRRATVMTLQDFVEGCDGILSSPPAADALAVNVEILEQAPGMFDITLADGHGAAMQKGMTAPNIQSEAAQTGRMRLDAWPVDAGGTLTGALELTTGSDHVEGTFSATVCP